MIRQPLLRIVFTALLLMTTSATASDSYQTHCAQCHGASGQGNDALGAPNLTRLSAAYIQRQLEGFRAGWRKSDDSYTQTMMAAIASLDASVLASATSAIDAFPDVDRTAGAIHAGNKERGKDLYNAYCSACHGTNGIGNDALGAPNLIGLSQNYLSRQYLHFAKGRRGGHPDDRYGQQMARLAKALKDSQLIDDVSIYVASLAE
jgi:cytochrome c553